MIFSQSRRLQVITPILARSSVEEPVDSRPLVVAACEHLSWFAAKPLVVAACEHLSWFAAKEVANPLSQMVATGVAVIVAPVVIAVERALTAKQGYQQKDQSGYNNERSHVSLQR
jgi:hypothetical protein